MNDHVATGAVNHLVMTVGDLDRSCDFYTGLLGFQKVMDLSPTRALLSNGSTVLALGTAPDPSRAITGDRFDENRIGLDHLSFSVGSRDELDAAARLFDERGVPRGEIKNLEALGMYVLAFRDPDNVQLELTAPHKGS